MNCFKLIKTVLDEAYAQIPGTEAEKDEAIKKALSDLKNDYGRLLSMGCLDYSDPIKRFAYIYKYTTSHANYVFNVLKESTVIIPFFRLPKLTVATIGGGPGSDFLGILKFCQASGYTPEVKCLLYDRDPAWGESWQDVGDKISPNFKISTTFQTFDVTKPKSYQFFQKYFASDIFTLVYFMLEAYALKNEADAYFELLFANIPKGAAVLFIDNNNTHFVGWFDSLAAKHSVKVDPKDCFGGTMTTTPSEEKTDLKEYYDKFKNESAPKMRADLAYRIGIKQ
jgi:hypothetical protein